MTFRFIADHRGEWPVAWACGALEVSESGYYAWAGRSPSEADLRRDQLVAAMECVSSKLRPRCCWKIWSRNSS